MVLSAALGGCKKHNDDVAVNADTPVAPTSAAASVAASASAAAKDGDGVAGGEAQVDEKSGRDPEIEKSFLKAMADARALHEKKDYAGAVRGFQGALVIAPDDPRGLSELGWAAFFLNDLDLAEGSTRKAIELAKEPYLKASSYYNLGRIQEERGQKDLAKESYKKSLEFKMNTTVKERLAQIDAALASSFEVLGVRGAAGPRVSLDSYCEGLEKKALPEKVRCEGAPQDLGDAFKGPSRVLKPGAPYLAVRVIASARWGDRDEAITREPPAVGGGTTEYHLAIRTKAGWFVVERAMTTENPGKDGITESVEVKELAVRGVVPGGSPFVLLRALHYRGDSNMSVNELEESTDEGLTVCGAGPSGIISCTRPIRLSWSERVGVISPGMDAPGAKHSLRDVKGSLTAAFLPDGQLEIKAVEGTEELPDDLRGLPGKHTLKFP